MAPTAIPGMFHSFNIPSAHWSNPLGFRAARGADVLARALLCANAGSPAAVSSRLADRIASRRDCGDIVLLRSIEVRRRYNHFPALQRDDTPAGSYGIESGSKHLATRGRWPPR